MRPFFMLNGKETDRPLSSLADALYLLVCTSSSTVLVGQLLNILDRLADCEDIPDRKRIGDTRPYTESATAFCMARIFTPRSAG